MKKEILVVFLVAALLLSGCTQEEPLVGGDKDEHGCIGSAGYTWCEAKQKCLRIWEEPCAEEELEGYIEVSVEDAKELIDSMPEIIILDVSGAYDKGHIPGSINYYIGDGSLEAAIPTFDPEATYLVYCHFESASIAGAEMLAEAGFENVYRIVDGYPAWVEAGYPVEGAS